VPPLPSIVERQSSDEAQRIDAKLVNGKGGDQMRFANEILNFMTPQQIKSYQENKLRTQLNYCYNNSEYYRTRFKACGAQPADIRTIQDFRKLPIMMTKLEERDSQKESLERFGHPFGMHLCAKLEELELTSTTSGTSGTPTFTYTFSRREINGAVADLWAFLFRSSGIMPGDRVLFAYALGVYATSMLLWGIRRMGALPIDVDVRAGADSILQYTQLTKPVSFATTPSLAEHMIVKAPKSIGKEVGELGFKSLLLCGEPGPGIPEVKQRLESAYRARVFDYWSPGGLVFGLACDSDDYHGLHCFAPDYNLAQDDLIDPISREPIESIHGAVGELVHTSLERDACPVIRYAYGDIVQVLTDPCPNCGFTGKRLKFVGRSDDMLIVKGVNFYPAALREIISEFSPLVTGAMKIILEVPPPRVVPPLKIRVEYGEGVQAHQLPDLEKKIKEVCHRKLKINPEINWVPPYSFERMLRKTSIFEKAYEQK
jgi:phenylacetate-CoA ligase